MKSKSWSLWGKACDICRHPIPPLNHPIVQSDSSVTIEYSMRKATWPCIELSNMERRYHNRLTTSIIPPSIIHILLIAHASLTITDLAPLLYSPLLRLQSEAASLLASALLISALHPCAKLCHSSVNCTHTPDRLRFTCHNRSRSSSVFSSLETASWGCFSSYLCSPDVSSIDVCSYNIHRRGEYQCFILDIFIYVAVLRMHYSLWRLWSMRQRMNSRAKFTVYETDRY